MSDLKPALTAEEWETYMEHGTPWETGDSTRGLDGDHYYFHDRIGVVDRHLAAALALHGQEFGFTWEDVDAIRSAAHGYDCGDFIGPTHGSKKAAPLYDLADRIAALLPPRE